MIDKIKAHKIAQDYLKLKNREYVEMDKPDEIIFNNSEQILYGKWEGKVMPTYSVSYGVIWGIEIRSMFIVISAENGDVLYTISSTSWLEESENT